MKERLEKIKIAGRRPERRLRRGPSQAEAQKRHAAAGGDAKDAPRPNLRDVPIVAPTEREMGFFYLDFILVGIEQLEPALALKLSLTLARASMPSSLRNPCWK